MTPQPEPASDTIYQLHEQIERLSDRLTRLEQNSLAFQRLFHPAVGLLCGLGLAAVLALACFYLFDGHELIHHLSYTVPIAVPFAGFLFDRALVYLGQPGRQVAPRAGLDTGLVLLALWRAVYPVPLISGHALFLTYALLSTRSLWIRIPTVVVLAEVAYFKIFLWHDPTIFGGALVGAAAALAWKRLAREP
jgi:ABC-type multidrug transport system fused ATPase/permease subunit